MILTNELRDEISLLLQFDMSSAQAGLKVHSKASPEAVAAAKRLFDKGLVDHVDGGYLTVQGREAAESLHTAVRKLAVK